MKRTLAERVAFLMLSAALAVGAWAVTGRAACLYVSSDLEGMFGKRAALAGNDALAELVTRPDAEEVIARALAAPAEAGEDPLRGVYLETFCAWLPELSRMAGV